MPQAESQDPYCGAVLANREGEARTEWRFEDLFVTSTTPFERPTDNGSLPAAVLNSAGDVQTSANYEKRARQETGFLARIKRWVFRPKPQSPRRSLRTNTVPAVPGTTSVPGDTQPTQVNAIGNSAGEAVNRGDFYRRGVLTLGDKATYRGPGHRELTEEIRLHIEEVDTRIPYSGLMHFINEMIRQIIAFLAGTSKLQRLLDVDAEVGCRLHRNSQRRAFQERAKHILNDMVRQCTTTHIGDKVAPAKGAFLIAARKWRPPTDADIHAESLKNKNGSDHPYAATARHMTVLSIRRMISSLGLRQWDPSISSYKRDQGPNVHGERPVHTVKDLYHRDPNDELLPDDVITRIDDCNYANGLKSCSGHHFALWASKYPALSGKCEDSVYYYDSPTTVTEIVGRGDGARYLQQTPWQFNQNDLFYLESVCGRRYSVYQVVIYYQPKLLKQVVFGCCLHTVNLPYPVHDRMTRWVHGHALDASGIKTIGPATNVKLRKSDKSKPNTRNILVMQTGTVDRPTVSMKYDDDIGPDCSVTITNKLYELILSIQHSGGRGQTLNEVQDKLKTYMAEEFGTKVPDAAIAILYNFMGASADFGQLPNVVYLSLAQQCEPRPRDVPTATAVQAMPPITNDTNPGVLAKTPEAMDAYVENRMKANINKTVPSAAFSKGWDLVISHFIKKVSEETGVQQGTIYMPTFKEVEESRNGPLQRARRENHGRNGVTASDDTARVDTKKEVAHKTGDAPRGVTNLGYILGVNSGRLGKGMEKVLKKCHHYNPGSTPLEIAQCVRDVYALGLEHEQASNLSADLRDKLPAVRRVAPDGLSYTQAEFEEFFSGLDEWDAAPAAAPPVSNKTSGIREKDFTKMDEMHTEYTALVTRAFIRYFFHESCVEEALEIFEALFNMRTKVGSSVIDSGWKNSSGSGITTVLNCLVNAVLEMATTVVSLCMTVKNVDDDVTAAAIASGEYELTVKEIRRCMTEIQNDERFKRLTTYGTLMDMAYKWIGPKFGDDALDPGTPFVSDLRWAVASQYVEKNIGMVTKMGHVSCVLREPCEYLSRVYPEPVHTLVSYCKIEKACDKLRISQTDEVEKYALKLQGYATTDINTPIVGPYIKAAAAVYEVDLTKGPALAKDTEFMARLYDIDRDMYFRLSNGPFPACEDEMADDLRRVSVAHQFGFTGPELFDYDKRLSEMKTQEAVAGMRLPNDPAKKPQVDPENVHRASAISGAVHLKKRVRFKTTVKSWLKGE